MSAPHLYCQCSRHPAIFLFRSPNRRRTESYAVTVRRDEIIQDKKQGLHRIVTARQKTGTHASVPIPPDVAAEVIALLNGNPVYVFWTGQGMETSATTNWQHDIRALFKEAGIKAAGNVAKPQITGYLRG